VQHQVIIILFLKVAAGCGPVYSILHAFIIAKKLKREKQTSLPLKVN